MKTFAPCIAICLAGAVLAVYAAVALATMPSSRGGEARVVVPAKTRKAPPPPVRRERGVRIVLTSEPVYVGSRGGLAG